MKAEPSVQEMIRLYEQVNVVIHGIGAAQEMAEKRGSSEERGNPSKKKGRSVKHLAITLMKMAKLYIKFTQLVFSRSK